VPEDEIGELLSWSDAVVLPYREASQSGVAAAALAAGRFVLATRVGGLPEQLAGYTRALLCEPTVSGVIDGLRRLLERRNDVGGPPHASSAEASRQMAISLLGQINTLDLRRRP
jgi:glycosyltransferase involved in cell wall biosynthesis